MRLTVEGYGDNLNSFLRPLIESECAFHAEYGSGKRLTVAFRKGDWYMARRHGLVTSGVITMSDAPKAELSQDEPVASALLQQIAENLGGQTYHPRSLPSLILSRFFDIWLGTDLEKIEIVQWGRNSHLDDGGVLHLSKE